MLVIQDAQWCSFKIAYIGFLCAPAPLCGRTNVFWPRRHRFLVSQEGTPSWLLHPVSSGHYGCPGATCVPGWDEVAEDMDVRERPPMNLPLRMGFVGVEQERGEHQTFLGLSWTTQ